jgi:hypothetical protein
VFINNDAPTMSAASTLRLVENSFLDFDSFPLKTSVPVLSLICATPVKAICTSEVFLPLKAVRPLKPVRWFKTLVRFQTQPHRCRQCIASRSGVC